MSVLSEDSVERWIERVVTWQRWRGGEAPNRAPILFTRNLVTGEVYLSAPRTPDLMPATRTYEAPFYLGVEDLERLGAAVRSGEVPAKDRQGRLVYNVAQVDGVAHLVPRVPARRPDLCDAAAAVVAGLREGPRRALWNRPRILYNPVQDCIWMVSRYCYAALDDYYADLLHELAHSTGHPARLGRFRLGPVDIRGAERAVEEIVAALVTGVVLSSLGWPEQAVLGATGAGVRSWMKEGRVRRRTVRGLAEPVLAATRYLLGGQAAAAKVMG